MLYHSPEFAVFLAATAAAFFVAPVRLRPPLLLAASYLFYADFRSSHLLILLGVTAVTYEGALVVGRRRRPVVLAVLVALVLSVLAFFKYYGFLWGLAGTAPPGGWTPVLPVGISFYTFQAVSYLVDVYRGDIEAERSPVRVALYLAFFPQVLAGPIERAGSLMHQFDRMERPPLEDVFVGAKVVLWGLFCKLVVADKVGLVVDPLLDSPGDHPGAAVLAGVYLYSFQIFFDFYGYTNVSIGLARALGVRLSFNFNNPYGARSIREFWRRWHITLTTWFRDYVYVPLGGRAPTRSRGALNVIVVFLLSGLWHGASLNFVAWGGLHAFYYLAGAATVEGRDRLAASLGLHPDTTVRRVAQVLWTFHLVTFAWLIFRLGTPGAVSDVARQISSVGGGPWLALGDPLGLPSTGLFLTLLVGTLAIQATGAAWLIVSRVPRGWSETASEVVLVNAIVLGLVLLGDVGAREYIYFQF